MIVKRGKRELSESTAVQTGKKMKRTLLCTYFMTLASVVLCFAMFLGTTLAWFSSEVTNSGNVIQVGTLKAMLYHVAKPAVVDAEGKEVTPATEVLLNDNIDHHVFDENYKWAPKKTQAQVLKVVNTGDLNFNYTLSLLLNSGATAPIENAVTPAEQLQLLLSSFELYVCAGNVAEDALFVEANRFGSMEGFLKIRQNEENHSTELEMKELEVFKGTLVPNVTLADGAAATNSVQYITVGIKMLDSTDISLMGQSFSINVKLSATQTTVE